ncbi:MAG: homoserine O-acetyltransferase [Verrucomicrobia bacterium]|nr:homoserine O-acetyltransferase [Verrucomicrobiota bacterium]
MTKPQDTFESSDSVRTAQPLRHVQTVEFAGPIKLELGGELPGVTVAYETYGRLSERRDNAILACHALSGDSHVAQHDAADDPGWWDAVVGPGKAMDTDKYFVVCPNMLGGCRGTTGPNSTNPATGKPYGADFPNITTGDIVDVQRRLADHLGIEQWLAIAGGSMGGHQSLVWATRYPERVRGAIPLATSPRLTSQALAFDVVGRNAIFRDPHYHGGQYYDKSCGPHVGLALARMLGHITYLSPQAMQEKFAATKLRPRDVATEFEKKFSVGSYLAYQGDKFVERFDANSYITLSMAMDLFDLGATPGELADRLAKSQCRWLIISFTSDWLFPPEHAREIVDTLIALGRPVSYCNVRSDCGHDAFLLEDELPIYGGMISGFLENLRGEGPATQVPAELDGLDRYRPQSIFSTRRLDHDRIVELIPPQASVLDIGCGGGPVLSRLRQTSRARLMGLELDEQALLACVRRGLDVVQVDVNKGLRIFADGQFDVVVLSLTLQSIRNVERVIADMLRVGRKAIVSFPNFGYHKLRATLANEGRAPEPFNWMGFRWYNTPAIRFLTIADFEEFCRERNFMVHQRVALNTEEGREVADDANRHADMAIFVLSL